MLKCKTTKQVNAISNVNECRIIRFLKKRHILAKKIKEGSSKSPDIFASYKDEKYRLEIKSRFEGKKTEIDDGINVELKDYGKLNWTKECLRYANKQFNENSLTSDLNILILHINDEGNSDMTITDVLKNLYGSKVIASIEQNIAYNLFGFHTGRFKEYPTIDAVIVFYDKHPLIYPNLKVYDRSQDDLENSPIMLVNPYSQRLDRLRASYMYGLFDRDYILHDRHVYNEHFNIVMGDFKAVHLDITLYKGLNGLDTNDALTKIGIDCPYDFEISGLVFTGVSNSTELSSKESDAVFSHLETVLKSKL